ncbi:hypothetical protein BC829DRAFT_240735 [Chytridium lagenaria]|nr:hypothetical protein BC829DRAFT_240735 [Chytridium lagenaria]
MSKLPIVEDKAESDHTPIKKGEISAGQIYMPKFDFSFAINTERKSSPPASPLDATFSKNLGLAVKRVTASPLKTSKTSDMELHEPKIPQGLFASEHLTPREKDSAKILDGVYICLSSKVQNRRHQIAKVCQKLGASLLASFSNICTHLVHEGQRQNEVLKEFKQAKQAGLPIVSPYWLFDCEDRNMRLNEMNYPHTFNPNKTLRISASTQGPYSTQSISSRKMQKFLLPTKSDLNTDQSSDDLEKEFADLPKKDSKEDKLKEDIVPVEVKAKKPNVLKFVDAVNQILVHKKMESESTHGTTSSVIHEASSKRPVMGWTLDDLDMSKDDIQKMAPSETYPQSLSTGPRAVLESLMMIRWRDLRRGNYWNSLRLGKTRNELRSHQKSSREAPSESKPETSSPPKGRYDRKFIATGVSPELRKEMTKLIERLGGVFLDSEHWVPECTHLIAETITRTEKCLAALASGCWILKPGYVDASDRAGVFVNEDAWEWLQDNDDSTSLAAAIRPWRLRLGTTQMASSERVGAFKGWTVLLVMDQKKGTDLHGF